MQNMPEAGNLCCVYWVDHVCVRVFCQGPLSGALCHPTLDQYSCPNMLFSRGPAIGRVLVLQTFLCPTSAACIVKSPMLAPASTTVSPVDSCMLCCRYSLSSTTSRCNSDSSSTPKCLCHMPQAGFQLWSLVHFGTCLCMCCFGAWAMHAVDVFGLPFILPSPKRQTIRQRVRLHMVVCMPGCHRTYVPRMSTAMGSV